MTVSHTGPVPATATFGDALGVLRMNGLRASSARRVLLEALFAAEEPRSAERLAIDLDGDLASVYRNLETLERVGLVRHFHLVHGPGLYTLAARERGYLVCERCGAIRPVPRGPSTTCERRCGPASGCWRGSATIHWSDSARSAYELRGPVHTLRGDRRLAHRAALRSPAAGGARHRVRAGPASRLDPDHLVAVTSLVAADGGDTRAAARLGAWWGIGHAGALLAIGLPLIFFKSSLPAWLETGASEPSAW